MDATCNAQRLMQSEPKRNIAPRLSEVSRGVSGRAQRAALGPPSLRRKATSGGSDRARRETAQNTPVVFGSVMLMGGSGTGSGQKSMASPGVANAAMSVNGPPKRKKSPLRREGVSVASEGGPTRASREVGSRESRAEHSSRESTHSTPEQSRKREKDISGCEDEKNSASE